MKNNVLRKIVTVFLVMALALTCFSMVACGKDNTQVKKVSFEQAYDSSVLGGIGLLNSASTETVSLMSQDIALNSISLFEKENKDESDFTLTKEMKDNIIKNLDIAKSTLNGDAVKSEVKASDKTEYEKMYTISAPDMNGENVVYTFYFNETPVNEATDTEDPEEENSKDEEKDKEEETEIETNMNGIVIMGENTYTVTGEREIETDEEEFKFTIKFDDNNYVIVEQERGVEGQEFEYKSYKNGALVFESEVEYEIDENGEVELSFETTDEKGNEVEYSYEFITRNNEDFIKVELEINEQEKEFEIKVVKNEQGETEYIFPDDEVKAPEVSA